MALSRNFFGWRGKALEVVALLRREGIDNDSRKKNRQERKGLVQYFLSLTLYREVCIITFASMKGNRWQAYELQEESPGSTGRCAG